MTPSTRSLDFRKIVEVIHFRIVDGEWSHSIPAGAFLDLVNSCVINVPTVPGADPGQPAADKLIEDFEDAVIIGQRNLDMGPSPATRQRRYKEARAKLVAALSAPSQGPAIPTESALARRVLETYCEGFGLRKGMPLWDLATAVCGFLENATHPVPAAPAALVEPLDVEIRRAIRHAASDITRHTNDATLLVLANKIHRLVAHPGSASTGEDGTECPECHMAGPHKLQCSRRIGPGAGRERGEEGAGRPVRSGDEVQYNGSPWEVEEIQAVGGRARLRLANDDEECTAWAEDLDDSASTSLQRAASGPIREAVSPSQQPDKWRKLDEDEDLQTGDIFGDDGAEPFYDTVRGLAGMKVSGLAERVLPVTAYRAISGSALLGEAPPKASEAEQSPIKPMGPCICNRFDVPGLYPNCPTHGIGGEPYPPNLATPGATVQPQARPMRLRAIARDLEREDKGWAVEFLTETGRCFSCLEEIVLQKPAEEIAYRINSFEPPHQGEITQINPNEKETP